MSVRAKVGVKVRRWVQRMIVVLAVAVLGVVGIGVGSASAVQTGWTWFPPGTYAKFSAGETSAIVQTGVAGAAGYVSAKMPTPILKAATAVLGTSLWLTAKNAVESADRKCMIIMVTVWQRSAFPTKC